MEKFKELHEVGLPDSRQGCFQIFDMEMGNFRDKELADIHLRLSEIQLNPNVPEKIKDHFTTSKHLSLYSWFVYRFIPVAEFHAITSLEFALKEKLGKPKWGLKRLLSHAVENRWVVDNDFQIHRKSKERGPYSAQIWADSESNITFREPQPIEETYTSILIDSIPYIRNEYAHGSNSIAPQGFLTLTICADFINAIYRE
ncbi:hypothetical protein OMA36_003123 [Vibrio fluvialis]|nr:hypothetical protein [Vibrio fluvialis]EKO3998926.1 hypothetical protein [Vibrio fluvialis]